jgi:septal ring factor EnvC (AmiA/AmiB activator)
MRIWAPIAYFTLIILSDASHGVLAQTQDNLEQIDSSLKLSKKELAENTKKREQTLRNIQSIEKQIAERSVRFDQTRRKIKSLEKQASFLQAERDSIEQDFKYAQRRLGNILESAYLMGRQGGLKIALSQQGTQHMARLNHYARDLSSARQNQLDELQSLRQQLDLKNNALEQQHSRLNTLTTALEEDQRYLGQLKNNRLAMVKQMDRAIYGSRQEIVDLHNRKAKLEALLTGLAQRQKIRAARKRDQKKRLQALKNKPPEPRIVKTHKTSTAFSLPANAKIIVYFGDKREKSGLPWSGILMQAPEGTNITAVSAGEIVYADWLQGYGQLIIIDHGNGIMSLYGHNKRIHRSVGDRVKQSDIIASMGNTAGLKKPALYFEIRQDGVAKNPLKWFRS